MKGLIIRLLSLLGFTAVTGCDNDPDMYGCPSATYEIKGKVCDADQTPIAGIRVFAIDRPDSTGYIGHEAVRASKAGEYKAELNSFPTDTVYLFVTDADGEANGGEFASRRVAVDFSKAEYEGGDIWYRGKATAKVDVTLDKVEK